MKIPPPPQPPPNKKVSEFPHARNSFMHQPTPPYIVIPVIMTVLIGLIYAIYGAVVYSNNKYKLSIVVENAEKYDLQSGMVADIDEWDNQIKLIRINDKEQDCLIYMAISAGRDGIFDTTDDMSKTKIDVNWSKKIGKAAGQAAKQAASGFIEGLKKDSPHDVE